MNEQSGVKETYLTIEEAAAYLKLAQQTIRKYVLNKSIPYRKVQKSVRFRLSEIEKWIDEGGGNRPDYPAGGREGDLFAGANSSENNRTGAAGAEGTGEAGAETATAETETGEEKA